MKRLTTLLFGLALSLAAGAATLAPVQLLNPAGSTSGQAIISTGPSTAPGWASVAVSSLAPISANTVLGNATGSSAAPAALAVPSCSTSASALNWTSASGFSCNTAVNAATLGGATFAAPGGIGGTTPGAGAFTTLSASSTVSGTGFSTYLASPPAIGGTTPAGGAFTTLSASSTVSGTGFSTYLASPPAIGGTTAASGRFTTLTATSTITPSSTAGIVGTTTNDSANAGSFGEYQTATTTNTSMSTGAGTNLTQITLTAGDWDVSGNAYFHPAGSTTISGLVASISTTSATLGAIGSLIYLQSTFTTGSANYLPTPDVRISVATSTTVYLVGVANFGTSTMQGDGFIRARRVR